MKLKLAYFGTSYFSARFLEKLINDQSINRLVTIKLVVTQPDKPVGRKQILTSSPVKLVAQKYQIPVLVNLKSQISKLKITSQNLKLNKKISDLSCGIDICDLSFDINLGLVFAFGEIVSKEILDIPKLGFWNIHPSLLPKYRGASPTTYPLILGDKKTGVTIIKMDEKLDHGPIIAQQEMPILPTDRRPDLEVKLTDLAFKIFKKKVTQLASLRVNELKIKTTHQYANSLTLKTQQHKLATYTRLLKKDDGYIPLTTLKKALNNESLTFEELPKILQEIRNWKLVPSEVEGLTIGNSPKMIFNYFKGLYPWPGIWTTITPPRCKPARPKRLKITDLDLDGNRLIINKVQLEGKKEVQFGQFNTIYKIFQ